jgi:uncharacterized protein YoxC
MRFDRALLRVLAAIIIAVSFTTLGMFAGRRAQKIDGAASNTERHR